MKELDSYYAEQLETLKKFDPDIYRLIQLELKRQSETLQLIAAENVSSKFVLAALGNVLNNKTAEGTIGHRYHGGCEYVDEIERLAVERAKEVTESRMVWLQPHSGSQANQIVYFSVLNPRDKILSLALEHGGHLSHGSPYSITGKFFNVDFYYLDRETHLLDYNKIRKKAKEFRPKLIICGYSSYPREINFKLFREIADEVGAYLLADVSHIFGLILGGVYPSPVPYADFVTTSTYKCGGPRGGAIIAGDNLPESFFKKVDYAVFPGIQSTPYFNNIAAKAVFFKEAQTERYKETQRRIVRNAKKMAEEFINLGYDVLTGGTDTHLFLINVRPLNLTGFIVEKALEECGVILNRNILPYDELGPVVTSGIRIGTNVVSRIGMREEEMKEIASHIDEVIRRIRPINKTSYKLDKEFIRKKREEIRELMKNYPLP